MSTNSPHKPSFEGEISVFESPHASGVLLVDRAEKNAYGTLRWAAVHLDDIVAMKAIADYEALNLMPVLRRALKNPSNIVLAFCDGSLLSAVSGGGTETPINSSSPSGGNDKGWWSNGVYLCYRKTAVAQRDNVRKVLLVNQHHVEALKKSWAVVGLTVEPIEHFQ